MQYANSLESVENSHQFHQDLSDNQYTSLLFPHYCYGILILFSFATECSYSPAIVINTASGSRSSYSSCNSSPFSIFSYSGSCISLFKARIFALVPVQIIISIKSSVSVPFF